MSEKENTSLRLTDLYHEYICISYSIKPYTMALEYILPIWI